MDNTFRYFNILGNIGIITYIHMKHILTKKLKIKRNNHSW